jgi:hypothetical protein
LKKWTVLFITQSMLTVSSITITEAEPKVSVELAHRTVIHGGVEGFIGGTGMTAEEAPAAMMALTGRSIQDAAAVFVNQLAERYVPKGSS